MKRMLSLVVGSLVLASMSFGQETNVYSQNAVGYVKVTANPGEFVFIQTPFETIDGSDQTVETILPDVPAGTAVFLWDAAGQTFSTVTKITPTFWNPPNQVVVRGQGMFVQVAASAPAAEDIYLLGEVPGATTWATTDTPLVEGFNAVGNPYPTEITIETSGLQAATAPGDSVALWNAATQGYNTVTKITASFWNPPNTTVAPGDAIFVNIGAAAGSTYTETPGYTYPDN